MSTEQSSDKDFRVFVFDSEEDIEENYYRRNNILDKNNDYDSELDSELPELTIEYIQTRHNNDETEDFYERLKKEILNNLTREAEPDNDSNHSGEFELQFLSTPEYENYISQLSPVCWNKGNTDSGSDTMELY